MANWGYNMHKPVLLNEVIKYLNPKPGENFIDCTVGAGGHGLAILEKNNPGKLLAIDLDPDSLQLLNSNLKSQISNLGQRIILVNGNFKNLEKIVREQNFVRVNGILFDLGLSSWQIEESGKGFSFKKDEPLKMSFSDQALTAESIINDWSEEKLVEIFKNYGEEKYSWRIAKKIIEERKKRQIKTTLQLRDLVEKASPLSWGRRGKIDRVLARIFQALRIAVNDELKSLEEGIKQALDILEPSGRLVIISFHSLEDRIVKNFFREHKKNGILKILTKKPIIASEIEIKSNPRSRSAKLRAAIKAPHPKT